MCCISPSSVLLAFCLFLSTCSLLHLGLEDCNSFVGITIRAKRFRDYNPWWKCAFESPLMAQIDKNMKLFCHEDSVPVFAELCFRRGSFYLHTFVTSQILIHWHFCGARSRQNIGFCCIILCHLLLVCNCPCLSFKGVCGTALHSILN